MLSASAVPGRFCITCITKKIPLVVRGGGFCYKRLHMELISDKQNAHIVHPIHFPFPNSNTQYNAVYRTLPTNPQTTAPAHTYHLEPPLTPASHLHTTPPSPSSHYLVRTSPPLRHAHRASPSPSSHHPFPSIPVPVIHPHTTPRYTPAL